MSRKFTPEEREQRGPDSDVELFFPRGPDIPRPPPDLSDMDRVHQNVTSGRLVDIFVQLAGGCEDLEP
jgi:hypothetical protein